MRLLGQKAVIPPERRAAAEPARPHRVGDELVGGDLQRLLGLGHLDRLRGHVGVDVGVAVEAVGIGPPAPGAAGEIDIDEGPPLAVPAADRDAGVAAVGSGEDLVGQHLRQRAEHAVDHAKAGQAARGAGRRQDAVGDGARWCRDLDRAEDAVIVRDIGRQYRADRAIARRFGEGQRVVDRALDLRRGCRSSRPGCGRRIW